MLSMMHLVQEKMCATMRIQPFNNFKDIMRCKPDVIKGKIDRFVASCAKRLLYVLQYQSRFTASLWTLYAYQAISPFYLRTKIALEIQRHLVNQAT